MKEAVGDILLKEKVLLANKVTDGDWFMVNRNHRWYKKKASGSTYVEAYQIGDKRKHLIPNEEEVTLHKKA